MVLKFYTAKCSFLSEYSQKTSCTHRVTTMDVNSMADSEINSRTPKLIIVYGHLLVKFYCLHFTLVLFIEMIQVSLNLRVILAINIVYPSREVYQY